MRASQIKAAGVVIIIIVLVFGIVWFPASIKENEHLFYEVTIEPAEAGIYELTIPTLVDGNGIETGVASLIVASGTSELTHVMTAFGPAVRVNASGALEVGVEADGWGGAPSLIHDSGSGDFTVRSQAVDDFLISITIEYRSDHESARSNVLGAKDGMWGGGSYKVSASGSIQSRSNWTVLDGEAVPMNWDGIGNAFTVGLMVSLVGYPLGIGVIMVCRWKRDIDPTD